MSDTQAPPNDGFGVTEWLRPTQSEIEEWADGFLLAKAYNRPVAIQIATEAAKWAAQYAVQRLAALPAPSPLTEAEAIRLWHADTEAHRRLSAFEWFAAGAIAAERRHGIVPKQHPTVPIAQHGAPT